MRRPQPSFSLQLRALDGPSFPESRGTVLPQLRMGREAHRNAWKRSRPSRATPSNLRDIRLATAQSGHQRTASFRLPAASHPSRLGATLPSTGREAERSARTCSRSFDFSAVALDLRAAVEPVLRRRAHEYGSRLVLDGLRSVCHFGQLQSSRPRPSIAEASDRHAVA